MLTRFSPKIGAAAFGVLALVYMVAALAMGHSARSEQPVSLAPADARVDVWQGLSLMIDHPGDLAIVDVRAKELYELYHVPGAESLPGGTADDVRKTSEGKTYVLVIAESDPKATELLAALGDGPTHYHYLAGGAADWYLQLELPGEIFSSKPPPHGYAPARQAVRSWLADPSRVSTENVRKAVETLAGLAFSPDQLAGKKKAPAAGKKKKIAGGCG